MVRFDFLHVQNFKLLSNAPVAAVSLAVGFQVSNVSRMLNLVMQTYEYFVNLDYEV